MDLFIYTAPQITPKFFLHVQFPDPRHAMCKVSMDGHIHFPNLLSITNKKVLCRHSNNMFIFLSKANSIYYYYISPILLMILQDGSLYMDKMNCSFHIV